MTSTDQLPALINELRGIKVALYWASALIVVSVVLGAMRTYFVARRRLDQELNNQFKQDAEILFEKNELDELISRCRAVLDQRPNHAYARWYLGRSLFLKEQWDMALEQLTVLRQKFPDWAASIDPFVTEARSKVDGTGDRSNKPLQPTRAAEPNGKREPAGSGPRG